MDNIRGKVGLDSRLEQLIISHSTKSHTTVKLTGFFTLLYKKCAYKAPTPSSNHELLILVKYKCKLCQASIIWIWGR